MCGITGIVSKNPQHISQQKIKAATDAVIHRGPEGEGYFINESNTVALGHRRLCVIDLSEAAKQPMPYLGRYHIIHNGELYNYIEVKDVLQKKGYSFTTDSDTEVIVAAYDAYKNNCLQHFEGMFAFAIWDEQEKNLFAARDRFGEKPFFFFYDDEQLVFGSTIRSLWEAGVAKEVNNSMLYNFLSINYTTNPFDQSETFFNNIQKLPAASFLNFSLLTNEAIIEKYWQAAIDVKEITEEAAIEKFNFLFTESIKKRLRSDVPIGTSLSGGLDSSSIVAYCAPLNSDQYSHKCFTGVFPGFEKNEEQHASTVAAKYNLHHHLINITEDDLLNELQQLLYFQEEPFASASAFAQYNVYWAAKNNGVTVLLDGQGADEILGGYYKYYKWYWQELYRQKKLSKSGELKNAKALGINQPFGLKNKLAALFPEFASGMLQSSKTKKANASLALNREFAFSQKRNFYYSTPLESSLNGALYHDTFVHGLDELLQLADRNSMAHACEVRLPFLNHQLVEFLFSLPPHLKINEGWTKWLLRKTAEPVLPKEIVWRKDKIGFEPPQKQWMQNKSLQDLIRNAKEVLVDNSILDANVLNKKIQPHDAHAAENSDWKYLTAAYLFTK